MKSPKPVTVNKVRLDLLQAGSKAMSYREESRTCRIHKNGFHGAPKIPIYQTAGVAQAQDHHLKALLLLAFGEDIDEGENASRLPRKRCDGMNNQHKMPCQLRCFQWWDSFEAGV